MMHHLDTHGVDVCQFQKLHSSRLKWYHEYMLHKIIIRSIEDVVKIVSERPELKDLENNDVSFYRGVILNSEQLKKGIDLDKRQLDAIVSTPNRDSHGETVNPNGIDWKRYDKNPVLLWQHNASLGTIGTCKMHYKDDQQNTITRFEFAKGTELSDKAWALYSQDHQRAFSIGFRVKKWGTEVTEGDPEGFTFDEIEIFEISAVSLPANEDALTMKSFEKLYTSLETKTKDKTEVEAEKKISTLEAKVDNLTKAVDNLVLTLTKQSKSSDNIVIEDKQTDTIDTIKLVESIQGEAKNADKSLGKILKNIKVLIKD